ncbi:MAG: hypothetical protein J7501_10225 [Bdellovibrio sp.]|nr:hypothetical protein [Bdellovibrio sp.]
MRLHRSFYKKFLLGLAASLLVGNASWAAKNFCSMTLNSSDEINTFAKALQGQGFNFVELVPDNKDPRWFQRACDSGLKCDVLLISGHFGGLFFGESTSQTIDIAEMEKTSCQNSCAGILQNPKEVFLMGCNTLASQARDHRTIEQYLNVLLNDGIPLDFAEQVVASRYSQQGFSLEKRFSAIFNQSQKLYGFYSTGPLGKNAAPILQRYLKNVGNYSKHLDTLSSAPNNALLNQFKGLSFRETNPINTVPADSRNLFCALRSDDRTVQTEAVKQIASQNLVTKYFDSLASQVGGRLSIADKIDQSTRNILTKNLQQIRKNNAGLVTIEHDAIQVASSLGIIDSFQRDIEVRSLLDRAYEQRLDYSKISQICGIIREEPGFQNMTFMRLKNLSQRSPMFMLSLACYSVISPDIKDFLMSKVGAPDTEAERTIALQVLKPFWVPQDEEFLSIVLRNADSNLRARIYMSAEKILGQYKMSLLMGPGLASCTYKAIAGSEYNLGQDWACLTENKAALTPDICNYFADRNPDPENADDMRWYCWSDNKQRFLNSRPECYLLADSFKIRGNQMKQIWNCSNRDMYGY